VREAAQAFEISFRRECGLLVLNRSTFHYRPKERPEERALTVRLRDLAAVRVRYGYRRLTVLLKREGWKVGKKRVYRIYKAQGLCVRSRKRRKHASAPRVPLPVATASCERWSMDFVAHRLADGSRFRVLTVIDHFDRSCPTLFADRSIGAAKVIAALAEAGRRIGRLPKAITVDNGSEFTSRELDAWSYRHGIKLDFIRPGKPTENG
jgi:putative transposase